jgi:hypothetical protein
LLGYQGSSVWTWERQAGSWSQRIPATSPFGGPFLFDSTHNSCVLLNADPNGTMWTYGPVTPARYDLHGAGCPGTFGVPGITLAAPWTLPWLGGQLEVLVHRLPVGAAFLTMGFGDQSHAGVSLPADLAVLGMPGCFLRVQPEATVLLAAPATSLLPFTLPVPNRPSLLRQTFFQQALVLDPGANAGGATISNSMRGVIGSR